MKPEEYKKIREQLGTQEATAAKLGITANTISRRELGHLPIPREAEIAIRTLAYALAQDRKSLRELARII